MFETFDHTADLGIRVRATDRAELFAEAARALVSLLVEDVLPRTDDTEIEIVVSGERLDWLLFDWLSEILYRFETDRVLLHAFAVRLDAAGLRARARARPHDPLRHVPGREVKAITYHGLRVERQGDALEAEFIVDI